MPTFLGLSMIDIIDGVNKWISLYINVFNTYKNGYDVFFSTPAPRKTFLEYF